MRRGPLALLLVVAGACVGTASEESALRRGDVAFAQGDLDEALAEYRLAVRQGSDDPSTLVRVAHTYAVLGQVDDAGEYYLDAVENDPDMIDQAISDLIWMARQARDAGDGFAMATAVETALRLRPGVGVSDLSLPLARHYFRNGEYGRALPFYQKALGETEEPAPETVFETGRAYDEVGDCRHALVYFEMFRGMVRRWERGEADWYIGTCAFRLAREQRERSAKDPKGLEDALRLVDRTIEVGEPRNLQAQAWFEKGEILAELGQCDASMQAFARVRGADASSALADRAQAAYDEIRFGQGLESLREGRCR